ncbi:MAG TPA: threonine--tRNA ligase [Myxococcota bacterium]|nr:threonine--tRNA ligase [Myxococcota bacterium]HOH77065.1 threonine--tRNA ligase [Myxococcota bacterium]
MAKVEVAGHGVVEVPDGSNWFIVARATKDLDVNTVLAVDTGTAVRDMSTTATDGSTVKFLTFADPAGLEVFRHSSAHLMAHALLKLYPDAKPTIGPVVDEGFYYDFAMNPLTPEDLQKIESEMQRLVKANLPIRRMEVTRAEALEMFADNKFKVEMINDLQEGTISIYKQGEGETAFMDLCRGPHVPSTGYLKAFKLTKFAGAYWRADQSREQLQRLYGISFPNKEMLDEHLKKIEEALARDHRKIGQEMELFTFHDEGTGFPFWHANGMVLKNIVVDYWRNVHKRYGYNEIQTPQMLNKVLWEMSGHYDHYRNNMYFTSIDDIPYAVKPMNCPGGLLVYKSRMHSYREFPLRNAELGLVHRHEMSGVLHGLFRVRAFTQDDAHVFCTPDQVKSEVATIIDMVFEIYKTFGFNDVHIELSTRPDNSIGSDEMWANAEGGLRDALELRGINYKLNPGDGAFYGPKIDFHVKDSMGRSWQCGTIQVDFSMPERFHATYEAEDGTRKTPVMLHRAILGSLERFIGILIENYAGKFPMWLNPVQVKVLPVSDQFNDYAKEVVAKFCAAGLRAEADLRSERLGRKIRDAQLSRVNYQVVVGAAEAENGTVSVRTRKNENLDALPVDEFTARMVNEATTRAAD